MVQDVARAVAVTAATSAYMVSICAVNALGKRRGSWVSKNMGDKMLNDVLANLLSAMKNAEKSGKDELIFAPVSKLSTTVLKIMKQHGYLNDFEAIEDGKGGIYRVMLLRKINDCRVIKPRFPVAKGEFVKWERRFLPAEGFGIIIVSTSQGVMIHSEAKEKGLGGKLIAYVY